MSITTIAPAPQSPAARSEPGLTTPKLIELGLIAVCAASLLLMLAVISGAREHRHAMKVIGQDSAPSVIAAQHIQSALAAMDTDLANEFLIIGNDNQSGHENTRDDNDAAHRSFDAHRIEATDALISAAQNITFGDAEREPIKTIAIGLENYDAAVQRVRDLRLAGSDKSWVDAYRAATRTMDSILLPAAAALDDANRKELETAYLDQRSASARSAALVILTSLLTGLLLLILQIFLARRVRRVLNPLLICALAVTFIFAVNSLSAFSAQDRELRLAKEDAFDSIHSLWLARSLAFGARDNEGRSLLDPSQAALYEEAFDKQTAEIARLPEGLEKAAAIQSLRAGEKLSGFTGYLATELNNVTFAGERNAAVDALDHFLTFTEADRRIRIFENSGKLAVAAQLFAGTGPGQSKRAFDDFDSSVDRALQINQQAFDSAVKSGFDDVSGFEIFAPIGALAIALFTYLGVRPRLREYYA